MSLSHFYHPYGVVHHPQFEPEIKRAILASWASDTCAVEGEPTLRKPSELDQPVALNDIMSARRSLDAGTC
jgi:hypothetical protein